MESAHSHRGPLPSDLHAIHWSRARGSYCVGSALARNRDAGHSTSSNRNYRLHQHVVLNASSPTLPADQAPETEQESDVFNSDTDLGSGSVHGSLEADSALTFLGTESGRCLSCGSCFFCDNCYIACPDSAIVKSNGTYFVNGDYCKGCGICAEECPTGAITMIPVQN